MKTLYLDCGMGAAGDMLSSALIELIDEPELFIDSLNKLGLSGVTFKKETSFKCGIRGTHISVTVNGTQESSLDSAHAFEHHSEHKHNHEHKHHHDHEHSHKHSTMQDIEHIIKNHMSLPKQVQDDVLAVYNLIADAESHVHGTKVSQIHFHEVGEMDAIADIVAVCMLMDYLKPDEVIASPICVGKGRVKCAHGILPVPAPATAFILKDIPIYSGNIEGELCTPTGAALIKHFATAYGQMPQMKVNAIGYGMGNKDFEVANCVRAMLGESNKDIKQIYKLSCNVDDMTGEDVGFAMDRLFEAGALDVYTTSVGMKKSRPALIINVICTGSDKETLIKTLFKHTSTIGIREQAIRRYELKRHTENVDTKFGSIRCKVSTGYGVERRKYEYEDICKIATKNDLSIEQVLVEIEYANKGLV